MMRRIVTYIKNIGISTQEKNVIFGGRLGEYYDGSGLSDHFSYLCSGDITVHRLQNIIIDVLNRKVKIAADFFHWRP